MKTTKQNLRMVPTILAIAVLAAVGQAQAQSTQPSEEVKALTTPDSSVSAGGAYVTGDPKDRAQWGMYNGMRKDNSYLLFDIDYLTRDNSTGTWTILQGRNLGLDNRELRFGMHKQGDWKAIAEYNEIIRYSPFTVNTAMQNAGSTKPIINVLATAGTGSDLDFKLQRKSIGGVVEKWLSPNLKLEFIMKSEDKTGTRQWGRGYDCASYVCGTSTTTAMNQALFLKNAILLIPEPIDSNIKQFEAKASFHDEKLNVTAGYYGSFYTNSNGNISPVVPNALLGGNGTLVPSLYPAVTSAIIAGGGMSLQNVLQSPMSLQPDNEAHQFSMAGNYAFTPSTRMTFRYAYTTATQGKDFGSMGLASGAPSANLQGRFDTVAAQMGLTSRPMKDLFLLGNISYASKEDKTPNEPYNVEAKAVIPATTPASYTNVNQVGVPGAVWNNNHVTNTDLLGKLEASYRLPENFRVTVGWDYRMKEREVPESRVEEALAGLGPLRGKNTEDGYRIELRRGMSDTLNGSIQYSTSKRKGSDWTNLSTLDPTTAGGNNALNTYLLNTYCGGQPCYGQVTSAQNIIGLSATTPFPYNMADVERDKWKVTLDWSVSDALSLQLVGEDGTDKNTTYADPVAGGKGWRDSGVKYYSVDMNWAISDKWKLTGFASEGQATNHINHSTGYMMDLKNETTAYGMSLTGEISKSFLFGANYTMVKDINKYGTAASNGTSGDRITGIVSTPPSAANVAQAAIGLPDVVYRKELFSVFGMFGLGKSADIKVDLAYQKNKYKDWVWGTETTPFIYADNTTVKQQVDQDVTYVGVTYIYRFR